MQVSSLNKESVINRIRTGRLIQCTRQEYVDSVRGWLQDQAGVWIDTNQGIVAQLALAEVRRLDTRFDYPDTLAGPGGEMPPVSGLTFDPVAVWPEEPQCFYQPCTDTLVLILVTQKQANENDWTKARFFCGAHAKDILVHATSNLPSGHIVGIVKEPTWDDWENRETDA